MSELTEKQKTKLLNQAKFLADTAQQLSDKLLDAGMHDLADNYLNLSTELDNQYIQLEEELEQI
jgi:hypothetical protein